MLEKTSLLAKRGLFSRHVHNNYKGQAIPSNQHFSCPDAFLHNIFICWHAYICRSVTHFSARQANAGHGNIIIGIPRKRQECADNVFLRSPATQGKHHVFLAYLHSPLSFASHTRLGRSTFASSFSPSKYSPKLLHTSPFPRIRA